MRVRFLQQYIDMAEKYIYENGRNSFIRIAMPIPYENFDREYDRTLHYELYSYPSDLILLGSFQVEECQENPSEYTVIYPYKDIKVNKRHVEEVFDTSDRNKYEYGNWGNGGTSGWASSSIWRETTQPTGNEGESIIEKEEKNIIWDKELDKIFDE